MYIYIYVLNWRSTLRAKSALSFGIVAARWFPTISTLTLGLILLASTVAEEFEARPRRHRHYVPERKKIYIYINYIYI